MNLRNKAVELRRRGFTYSEISKELKVKISKSTISYWLKDVKTPDFFAKKIAKINIESRKKAVNILKDKRKQRKFDFETSVLKEAAKLLKKSGTDKDFKKVALVMLYLGEGSKWKSHRGLNLGSSDPIIVLLYIALLEQVFSIRRDSLKARISYRADQDISKLTKFWSKITKLPIGSFYKTKPDPRTVGKITKNKEYKGVCVISGGSTTKQLELELIAKMVYKKICLGR